MVYKAICQKWEESERGWGTRPDGYTLHLNLEDMEKFIEEYWAGMPDQAPSEYSRPCGTPYACIVDLKTYEEIKSTKHGLSHYDNDYPWPGGTDGWMKGTGLDGTGASDNS